MELVSAGVYKNSRQDLSSAFISQIHLQSYADTKQATTSDWLLATKLRECEPSASIAGYICYREILYNDHNHRTGNKRPSICLVSKEALLVLFSVLR